MTSKDTSNPAETHIRATKPCLHFFKDAKQLLDFMTSVQHMGIILHHIHHMPPETLSLEFISDDAKADFEESLHFIEHRGGARTIILSHRQLIFQLLLCRAVDSFLSYISGLMTLILQKSPEMLRSGKTETHEHILQYRTMEELIAGIAEKRVYDLAYKGIEELTEDIDSSFGFKLFKKQDSLKKVMRIVGYRNLIVHNRAVVNDIFLIRVPDLGLEVGDILELDLHQVTDDISFLVGTVGDIDTRATKKWSLLSPDRENGVRE